MSRRAAGEPAAQLRGAAAAAGRPADSDGHCVSCGAPLVGTFCHECGEQRRDERDLTLRAFAHYAVEAVTNADAKLYATLRLLVTRPGALTREFVAGRRRPYLGPLQLFLVFNLVFFLLLQLGWGPQAFTTDLAHHRTQLGYGPAAADMITARIGELPARGPGEPMQRWTARWTDDQREFRDRFNAAAPRYANSLIIVMVPLFAIGLRLLRRRTLYVRELVFGFHFFTFVLLFLLAMPFLFLVPFLIAPAHFDALESDAVAGLIIVPSFIAYLALAFRNAHGDATTAAVLRAMAGLVILLAVLTAHRAVLFFIVFHTV
jgi:hypothetical protein